MNGTENTSQYYIGFEEESDNFPDKRGGKYNGLYFFRDESGNLIYTGTSHNEWLNFRQEWRSQQESESEEPIEEPVVEQPVEQPVVEQPVEEPVVEQPVEQPVVEQPIEQPVEQNFENSTIYTSSNGGTPIENPNIPPLTQDGEDLDKLDFSSRYSSPNGGNDLITGTAGTNTFDINLLLNAKPEVIQERVEPDGRIKWRNVANANDNYHDHWLESIGQDTIEGFSGSGGEGDKINIIGHTANVLVLEESDDRVVLGLYSDQSGDSFRGGAAHDFDVVGTLTINHDGNFNYGSDVNVNRAVFDGVREFA